jgi:hypothetical protein
VTIRDQRTAELRATLAQIEYDGWSFDVLDSSSQHFLQLSFVDKGGVRWSSRKWVISAHATKSEIVQTAFKAVMTALEHEARESFLYRGRPILGPHFDIDQLHDLCGRRDAEDRR